MSAALGQIGAAIGAIKTMANLKAAWKRASKDGERLLRFKWLAYYGGRDPHEGKRCTDCGKVLRADEAERCKVCAGPHCTDCGKPLTEAEIAGRMECCKTCWYERLAESQAHKSVGRRYEP